MNVKKLNDFISESGYPKSELANKLGISRPSLYMKLSGERKFTADEIGLLATALRMTSKEIFDIFFENKVTNFDNLDLEGASNERPNICNAP